jgi:hypothetical protein
MNTHVNKNKKKEEGRKVIFTPIKTKSQAGIEYTKYKQVVPPNPAGMNHLEKKRYEAKNKKGKV